ncbi:D-alanine--D-alanine ligase family protein [Zooshikella harenae]|uniref:D-alanine--D-alanine ligase n=1 Tax=Zooshikella harenae TaxID=2827238 RepID=A0ABS5ZIJ3_9GAMM|nr:D-alanine--D-alanine ligase family protein [Zooshikella harenae]MBU2713598.1 D-alanine--D-alanine ligase [Zooshikella harenae]
MSTKKINVAIIFGGKSAEHEVSLQSARNVYNAIDKDVMKRLLQDADIPIAKFLTLHTSDDLPIFETLTQHFGLPLFIKPANMGSSIGVHKVKTELDYQNALKDAFSFDVKVIIEQFIEGREIECAVLGNQHPIASTVGEIKTEHEFYGYETKYIDENGATIEIPAQLHEDTLNQAREIALREFKVLSCEGLGCVDIFLTTSGKIFVNEINTIPGFTQISMYPKLWEASGINYPELFDKLLQLTLERDEQSKRLKTNYL